MKNAHRFGKARRAIRWGAWRTMAGFGIVFLACMDATQVVAQGSDELPDGRSHSGVWVPLSDAFDLSGELRNDLFSSGAAIRLKTVAIQDVQPETQIPAECIYEVRPPHEERSESFGAAADKARWIFVGRVVSSESGFLSRGEAGTLLTVSVVERPRSPKNEFSASTVYVFYPWVNVHINGKYVCAREQGISPPPSSGQMVAVLTHSPPLDASGTVFTPGVGETVKVDIAGNLLEYAPANKASEASSPKTLQEFREWLRLHPERPENKARRSKERAL